MLKCLAISEASSSLKHSFLEKEKNCPVIFRKLIHQANVRKLQFFEICCFFRYAQEVISVRLTRKISI